jgi:hypothetical protein
MTNLYIPCTGNLEEWAIWYGFCFLISNIYANAGYTVQQTTTGNYGIGEGHWQ